ncbi:hypothetical protein [Streptomyces griseorubiginosus]|uniref:hypothetical protein n=1 Tax=Streptomyces griseorubiginosus TaxID=67304 RepID=UPI0033335B53
MTAADTGSERQASVLAGALAVVGRGEVAELPDPPEVLDPPDPFDAGELVGCVGVCGDDEAVSAVFGGLLWVVPVLGE